MSGFDIEAMRRDRHEGTPGLWSAWLQSGLFPGVRMGEYPKPPAHGYGKIIVNDCWPGADLSTHEANARRIARVPEMEAEIERLRAELAAFTIPLTPACRRWAVSRGITPDIFDPDEPFDGFSLTIELLDRDEAQRVTEAMLRQIGGVD